MSTALYIFSQIGLIVCEWQLKLTLSGERNVCHRKRLNKTLANENIKYSE